MNTREVTLIDIPISGNFLQAHGTLFVDWTPYYNYSDLIDGSYGIVSLRDDSPESIVYLYKNGSTCEIRMTDGTNIAASETLYFVKERVYNIGCSWSDTTGKMQLIVDGFGAGPQDYDGSFIISGTKIILGLGCAGKNYIRDIWIYDQALSYVIMQDKTGYSTPDFMDQAPLPLWFDFKPRQSWFKSKRLNDEVSLVEEVVTSMIYGLIVVVNDTVGLVDDFEEYKYNWKVKVVDDGNVSLVENVPTPSPEPYVWPTVWNNSAKGSYVLLSGTYTNNMYYTTTTNFGYSHARSVTTHNSGKHYLEFKLLNYNSNATRLLVGVCQSAASLGNIVADNYGWVGFLYTNGSYLTFVKRWSGTSYAYTSPLAPITTSDILSMALDFDTGMWWLGFRGSWYGDPVARTYIGGATEANLNLTTGQNYYLYGAILQSSSVSSWGDCVCIPTEDMVYVDTLCPDDYSPTW